MKNLLIVLLVGVCYFQFTDAVCCPSRFNCSNPGTIRCADCSETIGFGHCGVGSCNIFGCSCDGGCKDEDTSLWCYEIDTCTDLKVETDGLQSSNYIQTGLGSFQLKPNCIKKDDFISFFKDKNDGTVDLDQAFKDLDVNSNGCLEHDEIDPFNQ